MAPTATEASTPGTWKGTSPMGYANQWLRCDAAGDSCASIAGATAWSYKLTTADMGFTVRAKATATNTAGQAAATSPQTAPVANVQTLTFTGALTNKVTSLSFPAS